MLTVNINCAMHMQYIFMFVTFYKRSTFHESDITERESSVKTDAEELEEDDCQETEDLRSGISIEHGLNEVQAASHIMNDLVSNAVNVANAIDKV